jgi:perosamine synthetase
MDSNTNISKIPLCIPQIGPEEIDSVTEVLKSGWMAHGPKNHEFESLFCDFIGVDHALSMNSCTSALFAAIVALGIRGEVIVPSFTFVASVNAIVLAGAKPVLVDVDPKTWNISPDAIKSAISDRTEAIMVVHYAGLPAAMPEIMQISKSHHLRVIEDSAECLGGSIKGKMAGSYDIGCFSFFPTKNITTGEGGMLTTQDAELAQSVKALCAHGIDSSTFSREKEEKSWIRIASMFGHNFRLSNVLAAIGVEQMKKIHTFNTHRHSLAELYKQLLGDLSQIEFQDIPADYVHSWQMLVIRVNNGQRDQLLNFLNQNHIGASVHFDPPVHVQPPYEFIKKSRDLQTTIDLAKSVLTLPLYPSMTQNQVGVVSDFVHIFFTQNS